MTNESEPMTATDAEPECPDAETPCAATVPPAVARWTSALMARATHKIRTRFEERIAPLGIRAKHYGVLLLLEEGPLTQVEIGRGLWVDRSTVVALIDDLERDGLVARGRHPEDRRAHAVTLTERGRKTLRAATAEAEASQRESFAALSAAEQEQLREMLLRLL